MFRVKLINYLILPKSMGFDCWIVLVHKNSKLRWCELESDSLVNDQILREIRYQVGVRVLEATNRRFSNLSIFFLPLDRMP